MKIGVEGVENKKSGSVLLSHDLNNHSIIGLEGLNFRVRNGNGCFPFGIATGNLFLYDFSINTYE